MAKRSNKRDIIDAAADLVIKGYDQVTALEMASGYFENINDRGPKGDKGDKGDKGEKGDKGDTGDAGKDGYVGRDGTDGKDGEDGQPGLDGIDGKAGARGPQGFKGDKGDPGVDGIDGKDGKDGKYFAETVIGPRGYGGPAGPAGAGVAVDGSAGQVLTKIDATNYNTTWETRLANVVEDITPELGGNLDCRQHDIADVGQLEIGKAPVTADVNRLFYVGRNDGTDDILKADDQTFGATTAWAVVGNWAVASGDLVHTAGDATATTLDAANFNIPFVAGQAYTVKYTVSAIAGSNLIFRMGASATYNTAAITATGTYWFSLKVADAGTASIAFVPAAATDCTITAVSITKSVRDCSFDEMGYGFGTIAPERKLHVETSGAVLTALFRNYYDSNTPANWDFVRARGYNATSQKKATVSGDTLFAFYGGGYDTTQERLGRAGINAIASGTWTNVNYPAILRFYSGLTNAAVTTTLECNGPNVSINGTGPTTYLDINGDKMRLRTAKTPATSTAAGSVGDICWDASYMYVCTATNTWKRSAIATW